MNKQRKTSHILNVFQYDADGHVVLPASLTLGIAPTGEDNSAKVPTTAWVRSIIGTTGASYVPTGRTITINGTSYDLSSNRSWSIDTGVLTASAGSGISVSVVSQNLNIVNTGLLTATSGSGISVSTVNQNLNIVNTGLLSATAGAGISVSTVSQNLNIVNTGLLTATAGSGITVSVVNQNLNVVNTGILTASAGSGISLSVVGQNLNVVNTGVLTASAGAGISLSIVDGNLNVINTITNNNQLTNGAGYITSSALTGYATETYVGTQISNLVDAAPGTLDTLNELAAALGDDPNFATTVSTSIGTKVPQTRTLTINGTSYDLTANRSWTINSMVYPSAGIALSTGTAWGTSITDNSANWNTAYGWGNHASAGYLASATAATTYVSLSGSYANPAWITSLGWSKITSTPTTISGYGITNAYTDAQIQNFFNGANAITGYNKSNWDTAYSWGNHAVAGYLTTASAASTYVSLTGSYSNPSWITSLAYSKITGVPAFLTSYTETDTLASVTGRGASTSTALTLSGGATITGLTIAKSSGVSTITFPAGTNDPAFISHTESTANVGIMRFSVGDDNDTIDYFIFGNTSNPDAFRINANGTVSIGTWQGTAITDTYISSAATWNAKQNALNGTGFVKISGTTISYDNNTYLTGITSTLVTNALGYTPYNSTNPSGYITSSALSGYATQSWVTSQGYLTSLPSHNHDGRYIRLDTVNEQDGIVAYFRPATSGSYTMMKFESKVNQASDYGWILMQDDSQFTNGAPGTEDIRMTIGVFNDFQGPGVHSDELWFQGGARLVQNVGSWDTEYNTIIGTPAAKTNGTTYEWRVNNSSVMAISFAGVLSVGGNTVYHAGNLTNLNQLTNGPGYITGYTETDTLSTVVARGSTTTATISVGDAGNGLTGINIRRGRLCFSGSYEANHSIFNNINNIDGLGAWDGMKMNVYLGLDIRTGNHDAATTILAVRPTGVAVTGTLSATGNVTGANLSGTNTGDQTNISGLAASETLATVVGRGNSTGGGRPITLDNGGGSIIIKASAGGWSMGTYYRGSSDTILAGFGAYGGNNDLTWAWVGPGYESPWLTLNSSAVNSQVALQQGGNQVWHAGNLKVNYYQEDTSTLIPIGPYDKFVWGTGDRAAALIINDTAGARYAITAGSYDLSFYKHNSTAGTAVRAFYIDGNSTAGINNVTFETGIVSTNLTINRDLGTNDYSAIGQHNMQLRIRKASLDGGCAPRTLELGVLDNGTGIIQANHCGVGYNTLALNPVAGTVTVNGSTVWTQGNLTNLNQLTNGPGYITGYTETDTLGSVTGRGASTSTYSAFNGGLNVGSGKVGFRAAGATEFIQGEAWTMGIYGYNSNDGFLFYQRDTSDVARPCFHIGGWNNAAYGGYSNADSMITLVRGDGTKSEGATYATRGLSSSSYYSNIIKTTGGTIFKDSQSSHTFTGAVVTNGVSIHTPGDGGAGSQATVVAIRVRGLSGYESLELGTENNYDGVIRSYGNDIRYYAGHWRSVGSTSSENHSHYWYTSRIGSTDWSNHKMRLDHDGVLTVANHISTPGNLHANRSRLAFSSTAGDANHSIYNNYNNIDGEGSFDGMKMNVYAGLLVRTGNASGAVPTTALDITTGRTRIASGELWCGSANSRNGAVGLVLNDGALLVRADTDYYHKIWYYDGIAFGTNSAHGHFRFYAESNTQRNNSTGGATLRFDMDSTNGNFWAGGDVTAYSDARVKTDVKIIENPIEKIQAIRGVTFLRSDAQEQHKEKRHAGVIAQEILEVLPEVVTENEDGMYSVAYGNMAALLIEAIKEQQKQIEDLTNKINLLTQNK